jgi:hypothetical protein
MERRLERRLEWAESRDRKSDVAFDRARRIADNIPLGQPILVGHHSERHARADQKRIENGMRAGCESMEMAKTHRSKASGIERQLEHSVFTDDADAIEQLEARIAVNEAERDRRKKVNTLYRKGDAEGLAALGLNLESLTAEIQKLHSWDRQPYPAYSLTNLGARIRSDRERIAEVKRRRALAEKAEAAGGVMVEEFGEYVRVTFAEKPERSTIEALKAAGFYWGAGSWTGKKEALPDLEVV